jgi:hypothetical protein
MDDDDMDLDLSMDMEMGEINTPTAYAPNPNAAQPGGHPTVVFFHWVFKGLAVFFYLFSSSLFGDSFIISFVSIVVLLAFDFYVVRSVAWRVW